MKLLTARLSIEHEKCADLLYLGYFTNQDPGQEAIDAGEAFEHKPNDPSTLDFFIPCDVGMTAMAMGGQHCVKGILKENYERMLAHEAGEWYMTQIYLEIGIEIGGTVQKIVSDTSHNVPSDCDCLGEYAEDMLDELAPVLTELGFSVQDVLELGLEV